MPHRHDSHACCDVLVFTLHRASVTDSVASFFHADGYLSEAAFRTQVRLGPVNTLDVHTLQYCLRTWTAARTVV